MYNGNMLDSAQFKTHCMLAPKAINLYLIIWPGNAEHAADNPVPCHAVNKKNYHVLTTFACCAFNPPLNSKAFRENFINDVKLWQVST